VPQQRVAYTEDAAREDVPAATLLILSRPTPD